MNTYLTKPLYRAIYHHSHYHGKMIEHVQFVRTTPKRNVIRRDPLLAEHFSGDPLPHFSSVKPSRSRYVPHVGKKQLARIPF